MIKRELYMSRIRPFIGTELIKVMTGIRRCGKVGHVGADQAGTHGVRCQPDAVCLHKF